MKNEFIESRCATLSNSHFLYAPYKEQTAMSYYAPSGIETMSSDLGHYCKIDILKEIIENGSLRFTDVRYLNDSTEFVEIIPWLKNVLIEKEYEEAFRTLLLEESVYDEIKNYIQSYVSYDADSQTYFAEPYRTYTCSLSCNTDSLFMWNNYADGNDGVCIVFSNACDMFNQLNKDTGICNYSEKLDNNIIFNRGLVLYDIDIKKMCISSMMDALYDVYREAGDEALRYKKTIQSTYKSIVNNMRCFFKNPDYKREEEYRFMLCVPERYLLNLNKEEEIKTGMFRRGRTLIPYIDMEICKESIDCIVVNPSIRLTDANELIFQGINDLLWRNQLKSRSINCSKYKYREYG